MAMQWDLRAFLDGIGNLDKAEQELCFNLLDKQGFSAANKREAFFALNGADLEHAGISLLSTRKVLLLAIAGELEAFGRCN